MAMKLVIEPIFEADFCDTSYEFRPRKSAHDSRLDKGACPAVKNIGKPCAGKPHARFDEGGQAQRLLSTLPFVQ